MSLCNAVRMVYYFLFSYVPFGSVTSQEHISPAPNFRKNVINGTKPVVTDRQLLETLRDHGYEIRQSAGGSPVVLSGDVAYEPGQLVHEETGGRITAFLPKRHWMDADGSPHARYFFDSESQPERKVFTESTHSWINKTCIRFEKLPDGPCKQNLSHPAICVGSFGGCWSHVGVAHPNGGEPQQMSIEDGCYIQASAHEFGHALGSKHFHSRPDRDHFLTVNNENYALMPNKDDIEHLGSKWRQSGLCDKDQVLDIPLPYDYLSLMHYSTTAFGDDDIRAILVTKDVRNQYMLNYHFRAQHLQSHYDLYTVNVIYGCDKIWKSSCADNGKQPPTCKNFGYVGKNCQCICPTGYEGAACETKKGSPFPLMPKAKVLVEVKEAQLIDLTKETMSTEDLDGPADRFGSYQFLTVVIDGKDENKLATVTVIQTVSDCKKLMKDFRKNIHNDLDKQDCYLIFMWGVSSRGQLRTECFSTVANNEPQGPWFRSKTNRLDISAESSFGYIYDSPQMSMELIKIKMSVAFVLAPHKLLKVENKNDPDLTPVAVAARMISGGKKGSMTLFMGITFVTGVLICVAVHQYSKHLKMKSITGLENANESGSSADEDNSSGDEMKSVDSKDDATNEERDSDQKEDKSKETGEQEKSGDKEDANKTEEQSTSWGLPSLW